ncbi:universal stress protein [Streptomyces sp. NPDC058867]|uniref:universal stress protein n=1 Tax=unclassified Streptomyces TaxID=2593676 RepID=UPI003682CA9D
MNAGERHLVVGVDGSEASLRAVDWAADEAHLRGVQLRLVHACPSERHEDATLAQDTGRAGPSAPQDVVGAATRRAHARQPGLEVASTVAFEAPGRALTEAGRGAAAVVVGTRGRGGVAELLLGSVSLTVAAHAECPVVVLRGSHDNQVTPPVHGKVVVGLGDGAEHPGTLRFACAEARRRGVPLEVVRAWRRPARERGDLPGSVEATARAHEERAERALDEALREIPPDVKLIRRTVEGTALRALVDASHWADLLVVGARRPAGRAGLPPGRVAHTVLHHSACPVVVVPQRT